MTRTSPSSDADCGQAPDTGPSGVFAPPLRLLTLGLLVSVGIVAFDGLGVTTAMPRIASDLGGMSTYGWAVSALMLASVVGTVVGGYLADRTGPRRPYLAGLVVFIAGLLISATAPAWPIFLPGRAVQGLGVGAVMSMAYVVVAIAFPQRLQARALALLSGAWTVPALVGPMVSGVLTETASWRLLFLGLVPLVLVVAVITVPGVPTQDAPAGRAPGVSRNLVFSIGLAVSAGVLLAGLEQHNMVALAVMVILGAVVMIWTLREATPEGTLRARRGVPAGIATRLILSMSFFGIETFLPLAMTGLRGAGTLLAGAGVAAGALVWVGGSMLQSRREMCQGTVTRRGDSMIGLVILAVGIAVIAVTLLGEALPVGVAIVGWMIGGFGMGLAYNASTAVTFSETSGDASGQMSGTIQMAQTLGTALAAGIGTAVIGGAGDSAELRTPMIAIFALAGAFALVAVPLAMRIRTEVPSGTRV
ncbi:MFS transporter [Corynebacterium sp. CNJ-954]|uniref:MFS transporter n=1 Tax=Corynebacterium sp. CNJ-954 TaxID=1904962 RepID=UPI0009F91040|nr:MFS transporter [Corynebacterium sp. CNJ-954]